MHIEERKLNDYEGKDKIISSFEMREKLKNEPKSKYIPTGITGLDSLIYG